MVKQGLPKDAEGDFDIPALDISYDDALPPQLAADNVQSAIDKLKVSGALKTLAQIYDDGSSAANQTMTIAAAKGGPVILKAGVVAIGSLIKALTSALSTVFEVVDAAIPTVKLPGSAVENDPIFGSPVMGSQKPNDYMSYTSDRIGPLWGGTGMTAQQQPGVASNIVFSIKDVAVASIREMFFTPEYYGSNPSQPAAIVGNNLVLSATFSAVRVGAGLIKTIDVVGTFSSYWIEIMPTVVFTWDASGNISVPGTAQVGVMLRLFYDRIIGKYFPSYV
jgi:hypothetical protein